MSAAKRKGTAFETDVVKFLRPVWKGVERRTLSGVHDRGDIAGITDIVFECKATRTIDLAGAVDEAQIEKDNAGADLGIAVIKRRMKPTAQAYAVLPLDEMVKLLCLAGYGPKE